MTHRLPRTLIVDDMTAIRDILGRQLQRLGVNAVEAADGQQALALLEQQPFDLMLLDLSMPNLSGVDVVRHMRQATYPWPAPLVAVISANAFDCRIELEQLGVTTLLPKPLRPAQLAELIETVCGEPLAAAG